LQFVAQIWRVLRKPMIHRSFDYVARNMHVAVENRKERRFMRNNVFDLDQDSTIVSVLAIREPYARRRRDAPTLAVRLVIGCAVGLAVLYFGMGLPWG